MKTVRFEIENVPAFASVVKAIGGAFAIGVLSIGAGCVGISFSEWLDQKTEERKYKLEKEKEAEKARYEYQKWKESN